MAEFTAKDVMNLRERTGAGMMDCKKALTEAEGDAEKAIDILREKGLAAAAKKAGRIAAEGLVGMAFAADGSAAAMVEVNSETDFVAKNPEFVSFVEGVTAAALAADYSDMDAFKNAPYCEGGTVGEKLTALIAKIGENMTIRRFVRFAKPGCVYTGYKHPFKIVQINSVEQTIQLYFITDRRKSWHMGTGHYLDYSHTFAYQR